MNRPKKICAVFTELFNFYQDEMSAVEILDCASLIVEACDDTLSNGGADLRDGKPALCDRPVYEVISRWPWELVRDQYAITSIHDELPMDDYMCHIPVEERLQESMRAWG
jgi:hypothetical protein